MGSVSMAFLHAFQALPLFCENPRDKEGFLWVTRIIT